MPYYRHSTSFYNYRMMNKFQIAFVLIIFLPMLSYSQNMQIVWQQCIGGSNEERSMDIISVEGGYLIVGWTESNDGDVSINKGSGDAWLIKTDNLGNILWEKTYGGTNGELWRRIFPAPENCYYLLGASGSSDGDISYDPYPSSNDLWIAKIDSIGSLIWEKIIGGGMIDMVESGVLANDGGVVVFGWTGSQNGDITVNYGMYDMWMIKMNSDGEIEWDKSLGTDDFDYGHAIIKTDDGGFLVGGASTIGNGGNLTCEPFNYNAEAILVKLDSVGNIEWQQCYGGSGHDGIYGLLELVNGYAFTAFAQSPDGDVTGWHGDSDIWFVKTDLTGNIIWQHCYGGYKGEIAHDLFIQENGNFRIFGQTYSNDGDVEGNHSSSEFENDIWMFTINNEGELLWQQCYGGQGNESISGIRFGIVKKEDSNYVIAALTDFGPSYDVQCTPHGGWLDKDIWLFEIKDTTTNISTSIKENAIKVYPNPAKDFVVFEVRSSEFEVWDKNEIRITNTFGQQVALLPVKSDATIWDTRDIQSGIYFYYLENERIKYNGKVVIQK